MKRFDKLVITAVITAVIGTVIGVLLFSCSTDTPDSPPIPPQQRDFSPYYNNLDAEHKSLYDYICDSALSFEEQTKVLPFAFDISDLELVCDSIRADRPDLFYLDYSRMELKHSSAASTVILKYIDKISDIKTMIEEYDKAIEDFRSECDPSMTDLEKEQYTNDFICRTCKRSTEDDPLHNTAYGCLVLKTACCDGYSYSAKALFDACNIDSYIVFGKAADENHVWNLVKTDNGYAHLDVMWNDADIEDGLQFHGYFNLSDEEIKKDHTISEKYAFLPSAQRAKNYYDENGLHTKKLKGTEDVIYSHLEAAIAEGRQYIELWCDETTENSKIAPYYEKARKKLNKKLGYEAVFEPFCIYEANKTNNAITIKIFTPEG